MVQWRASEDCVWVCVAVARMALSLCLFSIHTTRARHNSSTRGGNHGLIMDQQRKVGNEFGAHGTHGVATASSGGRLTGGSGLRSGVVGGGLLGGRFRIWGVPG
eukprot:7159891-Alexandrium_andersonii.AAC.1